MTLLTPLPAAGFEEPLEMLRACHQRVTRMLILLDRLQAHLERQGADAPAAQAAVDLLRYFDLAGPAHHEDEERHVFPALKAHAQARLRALAERLAADHAEMAERWTALRLELIAVRDGQVARGTDAHRAARWAAFAALYQRHMADEEDVAYPAAASARSAGQWADAGREMAQRRGLPPPGTTGDGARR